MCAGVGTVWRERKAPGPRKATKLANFAEQFYAAHPGLREWLSIDHDISRDMRARVEEKGWTLSEKQIAFAERLATQVAERANEPKVPVVEGKAREIEGVILTTKIQESSFGSSLKMLVRTDGGEKLWGSVPAGLREWHLPELKSERIRFVADVLRSERDECFGLFKRPRKAVILDEDGSVLPHYVLGPLPDNPGLLGYVDPRDLPATDTTNEGDKKA